QTVKLCAHDPGVLDKLELPLNIGIHCHKLQSALRVVGRRRLQRIVGIQFLSIFPAPAQKAMEPRGCNQVASQLLVAEAQDVNQMLKPALLAAENIGIARVGSPNVRPKRTSSSRSIRAISKLVETNILFSGGLVAPVSHSGNRAAAHGN